MLECVPASVGKAIADAVEIPIIGIGAGPYVDGQVQSQQHQCSNAFSMHRSQRSCVRQDVECVPICHETDLRVAYCLCAFQVLVYHDMMGMLQHPHHQQFVPRFCKPYANLGEEVRL